MRDTISLIYSDLQIYLARTNNGDKDNREDINVRYLASKYTENYKDIITERDVMH